jgi:hypothetical protein
MATQVTAANVLSLEEHSERLPLLYLEPLLPEDSQSGPGRRAREAVESGLYGHLWQALETWRQAPPEGWRRSDTPSLRGLRARAGSRGSSAMRATLSASAHRLIGCAALVAALLHVASTSEVVMTTTSASFGSWCRVEPSRSGGSGPPRGRRQPTVSNMARASWWRRASLAAPRRPLATPS